VNDGSGAFTAATGTGCDVSGDQRALIPFDYDRDGDPDYLITQVGLPAMLLENRSPARHWLTVELPSGTGRDVGAVVTVSAGGQTSRQAILGGGSYLAGPPPEAYIGLGDATRADVEVRWDDGTTVVMDDVAADQILRVEAPSLGD
jgi:enediyne biosynthesis protein E4